MKRLVAAINFYQRACCSLIVSFTIQHLHSLTTPLHDSAGFVFQYTSMVILASPMSVSVKFFLLQKLVKIRYTTGNAGQFHQDLCFTSWPIHPRQPLSLLICSVGSQGAVSYCCQLVWVQVLQYGAPMTCYFAVKIRMFLWPFWLDTALGGKLSIDNLVEAADTLKDLQRISVESYNFYQLPGPTDSSLPPIMQRVLPCMHHQR